MQILVHSVIQYFVSSSFKLSIFLSYFIAFFFFFRTLVTSVPSAEVTQLASLDLRSRDIDACAPLHSRENFVEKVNFDFMPKMTGTKTSILVKEENNIFDNLCYDVSIMWRMSGVMLLNCRWIILTRSVFFLSFILTVVATIRDKGEVV